MNNSKVSQIKNKALVLIDDANVYYGFKREGWELDFEKFKNWLMAEFEVIDVYFFGGIISKKAYFELYPRNTLQGFIIYQDERKDFFKLLKHLGYKVRHKPVTSLYDNMTAKYKRKCNFDVEIAIMAIDRLKDYDELVLCSGDGDFIKLLKYIKGKYKKTTIIAHADRLNQNLYEAANRSIFFHDIKDKVQKKEELP